MRFVTPNAFGYGSPNGKTIDLAKVEELLVALGQLVPRERIYFGTFPSEVRPESVTKEALDLLRRHAANDSLLFGAQTGSPRLLAALHRGHTVEDVYRATLLTLDAGLQPIIDFIFGLPGEAAEDIRATMRVITDLTAWVHHHSQTFMPLPGTPFADAKPERFPGSTTPFWIECPARASIRTVAKATGDVPTTERLTGVSLADHARTTRFTLTFTGKSVHDLANRAERGRP